MNLNNSTLDLWLKEPGINSLKRGGDNFPFYSKYETFKSYLDNNLHKEVTKQAIYKEVISESNSDHIIWLNDHGPDHIKAVIERASQLLDNGVDDTTSFTQSLNAREAFLLLNAIQVHDIGNFYGRNNHESRVLEAVRNGLTPILFDSTESKYINDIAHVHGGKVLKENGITDKNTIGNIKGEITSDGYQIRLRLLAAILRFADELADEKKRADIASLDKGNLSKGSEVFHAFSACLDSVKVNHSKSTVEVHFKVPKKYLKRTFGKLIKDKSGNKIVQDTYLIDEIYSRAIKMHYERIYCSKFWKGMIDIEKIWVEIEFYKDLEEVDSETLENENIFVHKDITFTLHDNYYPIENGGDIFTLCPDLIYEDRSPMNGENLKNRIR